MTYHPETDQLLEYTAGSLHPSISLCISVHLEYCEQCRQQCSKLGAIGGALLEALEPASINSSMLNSIWQRIDANEKSTVASINVKLSHEDNIPSGVKKLLDYDMANLHWRRHGPKVRSAELLNHGGIKASLIRIQQGASIPTHGHRGKEYTVILDGSFSDCNGIYHQGDFLVQNPGDKHSPTATADKDCLCLAVLEAPLQFNNVLYEAFNRLVPL